MIWVWCLLLCVGALLPLAGSLWRRETVRGRRTSALSFHRAQLAELEQDRAASLSSSAYDQAVLEVQRRLLTADSAAESAPHGAGRGLVILTLAVIPLAALGLYLIHGSPSLPALQRLRGDALLTALRDRLDHMPVGSGQAREGWLLLARAEAARGHPLQAAAAWRKALQSGFDPLIAFMAAEADVEATGHMSAEDAVLFRQALNAAPNAAFRGLVARRLRMGGQKTGGQKTGGQKTGGQKTGGQNAP